MTWLPSVALVAATGGLWALWVAGEMALQRRRQRRARLSTDWLKRQAWADQRAGDAWECSRWRSPAEIEQLHKQGKGASALRVVGGRNARRA